MNAAELRRRLVDRIARASDGGDEETAARDLTYARAVLVALAGFPGEREVELRELEVSTKTAALVLGLHQEYVRSLVRRDRLRAKKSNGEFRIPLQDVVEFAASGMRSEVSQGSGWVNFLGMEWTRPAGHRSHPEGA